MAIENIKLTLIIKACNEEDKIEQCIESCINASSQFNTEIILADALSNDNTLEKAKKYPVTIVQFKNKGDIGCGATAELGYQFARGEFILLIDGDMTLCDGFIEAAILHLEKHEKVAGVGGILIDTQIASAEDKRRALAYSQIQTTQVVAHLGGGGMYRKSAIESVEYFSHRALKAFEEAELGLRLRSNGWNLVRLSVNSVRHTGHNETAFQRLTRQWNNGRLAAHGAYIKSSFGKKWFKECLGQMWFIFAPITINCLFILFMFFASSFFEFKPQTWVVAFIGVWGSVLLLLSVKKKSLSVACVSIITWHAALSASLFQLNQKIPKPKTNIEANIIKINTDL